MFLVATESPGNAVFTKSFLTEGPHSEKEDLIVCTFKLGKLLLACPYSCCSTINEMLL